MGEDRCDRVASVLMAGTVAGVLTLGETVAGVLIG